MPLAFPSHQGLIAPLWRRWPGRFNVLALCVGAATPDVVDGVTGPFRGGLGQWYGHSLAGLFVFCLPIGLILTWAMARVGARLARTRTSRWRHFIGQAIETSGHSHTVRGGRAILVTCFSAWLGAFSHLAIDFVSHGNFLWLFPWYVNPHFFPSWWYWTWFEIPLPGYRNPYPAGPHLVVWVLLGLAGIYLFFKPLWSGKSTGDFARADGLCSEDANATVNARVPGSPGTDEQCHAAE